jgi:hypothetical protein
MKSCFALALMFMLMVSCRTMPARETATRYKFTPGETNAFAVEISVRSEQGSEVTTGSVIFVTKAVTTNSVKLLCRGNLKAEFKRPMTRGPGMMYPGYYPGGRMQNLNAFPNDCEIDLDGRGYEIRDDGDYVLPAPLGKLAQSIFEPLSATPGAEKFDDRVSILDDPLWLGPAEGFLNIRQNGQPYGMRYGMGYMGYQQQTPAILTLSRHVTALVKKSTANNLVEWHRQTQFESLLKSGTAPRLTATSETDFTFDRNIGQFTRIETQSDASMQTKTTVRRVKLVFKSRLLAGAERAAALAPPPPPAPAQLRRPSAVDLEKITEDLKSPDLETRRSAMRQINGLKIESPSTELVDLVAAMATDSDSYVRMTVGNFLGTYGTTNQVPVLLKLAKDSDWSTRQPAVKALGKLKDERAIEPLADLIARGGSMYGQDASAALINIGPPAEKAVLELLNERNTDTQRQACNILQQIGTSASLDALQRIVGTGEQQTSQAAVEAIRAIKQRQ